MSPRSRKYRENARELAARLEKNRPFGVAGLAYVLAEVFKAQRQGLIYTPTQDGPGAMKSKFANILV